MARQIRMDDPRIDLTGHVRQVAAGKARLDSATRTTLVAAVGREIDDDRELARTWIAAIEGAA